MAGMLTSAEGVAGNGATDGTRSGGDGARIRDVSFVGTGIDEYLIFLLGQDFKSYRENWTAAEHLQRTPEFPLFVELETVDACNLRCEMCFRRSEPARPVQRMEDGLFRRIIDEVRIHGCPSMCLNGNNEPLLDPLLPERVAMAREAGVMDTRINTNGMLLTGDVSTRLIQAGLTRLSVSIDAARPDTYARIRTGGDYNQVIHNVREFVRIRHQAGVRLPVLRLTFVVLQENQNETEEFTRMWAGVADYISFQRYVPHTEDDRALSLGTRPAATGEPRTCSQPFERLVIDVRGNVFPCCSPLGRKLLLGTLQEQTLQSIWRSARETRLRDCMRNRNWTPEPVCAVCLRAVGVKISE